MSSDEGNGAAFEEKAEGEEEEEDFMSDKFITAVDASTSSLRDYSGASRNAETYSERRRKQRNASHEKGKTVSRAERERIARKEGLARNLVDEHKGRQDNVVATGKRKGEEDGAESGARSKAMRMMMSMGFQPGNTLGKAADSAVMTANDDATTTSLAGAPLSLDERWIGARSRAGIGRLPPLSASALHRDILNASEAATTAAASAKSTTEIEDFRARARQEHAEKHAEALLTLARKTCEELDRSEAMGMTYSPLWVNPAALHKHADELPAHVAQLIEFAFAGLDLEQRRQDKAQEERGGSEEGFDKADAAEEEGVASATATIARTEEARKFCSLAPVARLQITLSHLRRAHHYCLFCGHQYVSGEQLDVECPGEEEDDH